MKVMNMVVVGMITGGDGDSSVLREDAGIV